jgi:SAM-dependent methyltransferase
MPAEYDAGRGYTPAVLESWLDTISSAVPADHIDDILDLGCGTGRYSAALAAHFNARVVAVDPSDKMLSEARKKASEGVRLVRGSGEAVPLESATVDLVFMSMVFHHFRSPQRAAEECHRVLREDGYVCLRAGSTDRMDSYPYVPFFPRTPALLANNLQSLKTMEITIRGAGFQLVHQEVVNRKERRVGMRTPTRPPIARTRFWCSLPIKNLRKGWQRFGPTRPQNSPVSRSSNPSISSSFAELKGRPAKGFGRGRRLGC